MKARWGNPEKTRVHIEDGGRSLAVPTTEDNQLWRDIQAKVAAKKLTIRPHKVTKHRSAPFPHKSSYVAERAMNYPTVQEFADAVYWRERGRPEVFDAWLSACDAVKAAHPKPTEEQA